MLNTLPLFEKLRDAQRVLIAGAGGGFDIFCGLPLYFHLVEQGKTVFLANYSFAYIEEVQGMRPASTVVEVTADSEGLTDYFPEKYLAQWFRTQGQETSIYCFHRTGCLPLLDAYRALATQLQLDTVVVVDGGTDGLMRGDEAGLGTPCEDISSIAAVDELDVERKILVCLGFGVDRYHGVCHAQFLEAVAELTKQGAFLGVFSLLEQMPEVQKYQAATKAVFTMMPQRLSMVNGSILAALEGHYGDSPQTEHANGTLWINPLMTFYWAFDLKAVAKRILYLDDIKKTLSLWDTRHLIDTFRQSCENIRPWQDIPV
jgi:hypothetical protein